MHKGLASLAALGIGALALLTAGDATASSHREAPFITRMPKVDGTDFYMFRSYDATGLAAPAANPNVTIIANYLPLQDGYGGPNFFSLDSNAIYEIHIDNTGDGIEDITFQFQFSNALNADTNVPAVGVSAAAGAGIMLAIPDWSGCPANCMKAGTSTAVSIPFINANVADLTGTGRAITDANQNAYRNVRETFKVNVIKGARRTGVSTALTHAAGPAAPGGSSSDFVKPLDFVGTKSFGAPAITNDAAIAAYHTYAQAHVYNVTIPSSVSAGCTGADANAKIFVGQRHEAFGVLLGNVFDLVNANAAQLTAGPGGGFKSNTAANPLNDKNVTTIAIEASANCLQPSATETVIGGWTTASVKQARVINPDGTFDKPSREGGAWVQVSRLAIPLINEVGIGLKDKNKYNGSEPKNDVANFANYITHPTLPAVLEVLFGGANVVAPKNISAAVATSRADLQSALLLGICADPPTCATRVNRFAPLAGTPPAAAEMLRLNVKGAFLGAPTAVAAQNPLGAAGCYKAGATPDDAKVLDTTLPACDPHGFPNGRRPGDDVVDISLRVFMGYLVGSTGSNTAPSADFPLGDAIDQIQPGCTDRATCSAPVFPYLEDPIPGALVIP
jgi:hypothetical protein